VSDSKKTPAAPPPTPAPLQRELAAQRRRWYRSFPEGTLEFVSVTRILWIIALFVLPIAAGSQRAVAACGISILLLIDFALVMAWLTRLTLDSRAWRDTAPMSLRAARWRAGFATSATITSHACVFLFAWTFLPLPIGAVRQHPEILGTLRWALVALFVIAIPFTILFARRAGLPGGGAALLLTVPILAWWSARHSAARISRDLLRSVDPAAPDRDARAGLILADVLWALLILLIAANLYFPGGWKGVSLQSMCSGLGVAFAAIADVAALETAHHRYLNYLRATRNA
jgi:hypothetical protein